MDENVLFEVKKEHLDTGLRGIPVGYCMTSTVHPEKGLFYAERPISEICFWEPERVIFLLYHGHDGTEKEQASFREELKKRAHMPEGVKKAIEQMPRVGHPMALYSAAVLVLGMFIGKEDYQEDCLNLIALLPELTAIVINHHAGWGETPKSQPELGYMANFSQMLKVPMPRKQLPEVLTLFNILHYDHGGGNLSTFVGKAVASGLADMFGSISSCLNALAGPRHGRANQECLHFLESAMQSLGQEAKEDDVELFIRTKLEKKELVYGFGHAVLRVEDPRATVQYALVEREFPDHPLVKMALMMRKVGVKVLKENPKITNPYPNVDAISGTVLTAAGFPYPEYYTVLFGLSRAVGVAIQIVDERLYAREGKGTPIVRPKYIYQPKKRHES